MSELVELHAIAQIPDNERHGRAASLLPLWFSMNASVLAVTTGVIGIELGASLASTIVAIVLGNLIGGLFMAYHSAQGPVLGLPQMVQSRAQFGFLGAAVPNLMAIVMYIGY
ncbi:MAG: nucleobase:cation symporter, family, partial [Pseudonocardiales bacterium]|nr:nucleobase:cation symporter, family [Pseudonocardiales bacterium]